MVKTIVLRFRDLVTHAGGTIDSHQTIALAIGHVWWGWWRKSGETVPEHVFRALGQRAKSAGHLQILLFDSGRERLFSANCTEIKWDTNLLEIVSPDANSTPVYYATSRYVAWFQLNNFVEITDARSELHKYTYVRVDDFFENRQSRYDAFYGKRVSDLEELRQQDRTIWFLKQYEANEPFHDVRLLNARAVTPSNFDRDFNTSKSRNLLWLSDLHFSEDPHHAFPNTSSNIAKDLGQATEDALKTHEIQSIAGVIVSGDLTWKATAAEFRLARQLIARLARSPSQLENYRFAICPGNHDIAFGEDPSDKGEKIHDVLAPEVTRAAWNEFYRDLFYIQPNAFLSSGRRLLLGAAVPVEIVCLNSSLLEQKSGWFQGHGFVGGAQLDGVVKEFAWTEPKAGEPRPFRILVLHHHLMPVVHTETPWGGAASSVVYDAEAVVQWAVKYRIDLVLHGHMHTPFRARVSRPIGDDPQDDNWHTFHVLGLGSSGVASEHRDDKPNMIGVLRFVDGAVDVEVVTVHKTEVSRKIWSVRIPLRAT